MLEDTQYLEEEMRRPVDTPAEDGRRAVKGLSYADNAGVAVRLLDGLTRMMTTVVDAVGVFRFTVSEKKTGTIFIQAPKKAMKQGKPPPALAAPLPPLVIEAAVQKHTQTIQLEYLGGHFHEDGELTKRYQEPELEQMGRGSRSALGSSLTDRERRGDSRSDAV